jgi:hypothetical protein
VDRVQVRGERAALNEQVRTLQRRDHFGRDHETFALPPSR